MQPTHIVELVITAAIVVAAGTVLYLRNHRPTWLEAAQPYNYLVLTLIFGLRGVTIDTDSPVTAVILVIVSSLFAVFGAYALAGRYRPEQKTFSLAMVLLFVTVFSVELGLRQWIT